MGHTDVSGEANPVWRLYQLVTWHPSGNNVFQGHTTITLPVSHHSYISVVTPQLYFQGRTTITLPVSHRSYTSVVTSQLHFQGHTTFTLPVSHHSYTSGVTPHLHFRKCFTKLVPKTRKLADVSDFNCHKSMKRIWKRVGILVVTFS